MARPTTEAIDAAATRVGAILQDHGADADDEAALDLLLLATSLPELMSASAVAETLGTQSSNLGRWPSLPEPLYSPDHPDPRRRTKARLWDADAIRELAAERQSSTAASGGTTP